jgi:hypothetical protein
VSAKLPRLPRRRDDVLLHDETSGSLLTVPGRDAMHVLNPTARAVWELCDGQTTVDEVADAICQVFSVQRGIAVRDVRDVLQRFVDAGLVDPTADDSGQRKG